MSDDDPTPPQAEPTDVEPTEPADPVTPARVVCHTEGCANAGVVIDVDLGPDPWIVQCGGCGAQLTDVTVGGAG